MTAAHPQRQPTLAPAAKRADLQALQQLVVGRVADIGALVLREWRGQAGRGGEERKRELADHLGERDARAGAPRVLTTACRA